MSKKKWTRRNFLGSLLKGTATLATVGPFIKPLDVLADRIDPRVGAPNPYINGQGQPILVCVEGYNFEEMLAAALAELGGLNLLVDQNQDVLIKPNFVVGGEGYPTTSDPNTVAKVVEALVLISNGTISVGDAGALPMGDIYNELNVRPPIMAAGGELVTFSDVYGVRRSTWAPEVPDFQVYTDVYNSPIIINFCSLKRHFLPQFTCAIKNHVGTVSGQPIIDTRAYLHSLESVMDEFLVTLAEIAGCVNSELAIVDARSILAVNGPFVEPIVGPPGEVREVNKIVVCGDMVATDAYCAQLMLENDATFDPASIQLMLQQAETLGMGTSNLNEVEIIEINITGKARNYPVIDSVSGFELHKNYPNPFNPSTTISFNLPKAAQVQLSVHNSAGQRVATLIDDWRLPGKHEELFNASNLASGTYFYRFQSGDFRAAGKMLLVK